MVSTSYDCGMLLRARTKFLFVPCNGHGNCMRVCQLVSRSISSKLLGDIGLHLYSRGALTRHVVGYHSALGRRKLASSAVWHEPRGRQHASLWLSDHRAPHFIGLGQNCPFSVVSWIGLIRFSLHER
jgi:hypothetical protein